ncbi:hypothetical protein GCM10009626_01700 [Brachybacterium sacelli]
MTVICPSGSEPHSTFAPRITASPTLAGFRPNSLNKIAEPDLTTITVTQSYATGPTGEWIVRVRARIG